MKFNLTGAFALLILIWSCDEKPQTVDNTITIAGKLDNAEASVFKIHLDDELGQTAISEDGTFVLKFENEESDFFRVECAKVRSTLYLSPGDSIFISADVKEFGKTFMADGDKADENIYLRKKAIASNESGLNNLMELMKHEKDTYFIKKDSILTAVKSFLDHLADKEGVDKDFIEMEEAFFKYQSLYLDNLYPMYHAHLAKTHSDSVDFPIAEIRAEIENIPLDQVKFLSVGPYKAVVDTRIRNLTNDILKADSSLKEQPNYYELANWMAIDSLLKNAEIRDHFLFETVKSQLEYRGPVHSAEAYDRFMQVNETPKYADKLGKINAKWDPISPGKDVPDFKFTDIHGDEVKLSDLRGQLVYIDIWATWCGPCIGEHPHWDKLKAEYEDKPVAFLTVSIDDSRDPWEKMVKDKKMDGLQWFAENAWNSELGQHFMVRAIPRFLLLDKEGKVIDPSADRPSGKIRETLDKHLEDKA